MIYGIEDLQSDPNWKISLGEKLNMIHLRRGHEHAECELNTGICSTHFDEHDPYQSVSSLLKHLWNSKTGKFVLIGASILALSKLLDDKDGW